MATDAKLGIVLGVILVLAVALVFFHNELVITRSTVDLSGPGGGYPADSEPDPVTHARYHTVREGENLHNLAQRYYGNDERYLDLYKANQKVLHTPDEVLPGTVLVIPDLTK